MRGLAPLSLVAVLCALLCAPGAQALAPPPKPLGLDCEVKGAVQFCPGNGASQRVPSFDGVPLDVDVTLPSADKGNGPFPTIVMLHGYGGDKGDFEADSGEGEQGGSLRARLYHWNNVWFASRGYVVVNYTARGFGKSCGGQDSRTPDCFQQVQTQDQSAAGWIHLKDRRREAHDTQHLLGLLVDQGFAKPDALGATGISYGGGESIELAYLRNRIQNVSDDPGSFSPWVSPEKKIPMTLAAAYPRWPWSDLVSALTPNGRFLDFDASTVDKSRFPPGVPIASYIEGLYALGNTSGFYAPPGADPTADLTSWNARVLSGEPYGDPVAQTILNQIFDFHQGFGTPDSTPAPLLIQNGWTDDLFPPSQALRVYNSLRAADPKADVALQLADLGHQRGSNRTNADHHFNDQASAFFDKHLKGATSDTPPPAPGSVTTFTQTCPRTEDIPAGGPFAAGAWPDIHPGAVRFGSADAQEITSGGGNPETGQGLDPISGGGDACKTFDEDEAPGTAVYKGPASAGFTLMGLPSVQAEIETTGPNGQLDSRLWDVDADGKQTLISRGVYRLEDNQTGTVTFQLNGNGWVFAAGHVPKLELLGQDPPYLRPSNGAFQVSVKNVVVELPALEEPQSKASFSGAAPGSQVVEPVLGGGGTVAPAGLKPRLRISYTPHRTRVGRRSRYLFRVRARSTSSGKLVYVKGARLRFAGRRLRTDRRGRAHMRHRFGKPGRRRIVATKKGFRRGIARVRVLPRRR